MTIADWQTISDALTMYGHVLTDYPNMLGDYYVSSLYKAGFTIGDAKRDVDYMLDVVEEILLRGNKPTVNYVGLEFEEVILDLLATHGETSLLEKLKNMV